MAVPKTFSFSVATANNGWIVRRIDSWKEGPLSGDWVFNNWDDLQSFLFNALNDLKERQRREKEHET